MRNLIFFSLIIVSLSACKKQVSELPVSNKINFENLAVGQKSQYVRWTSKNPWSESDTAYQLTTDTISLTIIGFDNNGFKVAETEKGSIRTNYYFKIQNDSLSIYAYEKINFGGSILVKGSQKFPLKDVNLPKRTLNRWAVPKNRDFEESFGKTNTFSVTGKEYSDAFIYYNTLLTAFDGPGLVRIYTPKDGFISIQSAGGLLPLGTVYNLIP